ncbi:hypothetical protein [Actinomadura bangladeshensis]|uniref:Uncharacterized protein n=1 Tax=Actinomadura bangladeshensis TaxID=453573 RepID=A0A4R4NFM9_9ACTN|nr:hypothetical protein [Actinomadura bangladeshensis]TDC07799.1 hypothetical protein E1284_31795 [Actinomadura bangladeshensis]
MTEEAATKYYAITGRGKTVDDPHGIARQRKSAEIGVVDEVFYRDRPAWRRTGIIAEWNHCSTVDDLEEISKEKAMQFIESWEIY